MFVIREKGLIDGCFASSFYPPEGNWPIEKCTDKKVGNSFVNNGKIQNQWMNVAKHTKPYNDVQVTVSTDN